MAYFKLSPFKPSKYPFDYHSHFAGILPVYSEAKADGAIEVTLPDSNPKQIELPESQPLSLAGIFGSGDESKGTVELFTKALQFMIEANPLSILLRKANKSAYERGECGAENIYVAAVILARRWGLRGLPATEPDLYGSVLNNLRAQTRQDDSLYRVLQYFNRKIYSANKYLPFDDAYKARSFAFKKAMKEEGSENVYPGSILASLAYLQREGVRYAQLALGEDEIRLVNAVADAYNKQYGTGYKLLAHTATVYVGDKAFREDLEKKLLPLFAKEELGNVIGIDLLGSENRVGDYVGYFTFLEENRSELVRNFGQASGSRSTTMVNHIHCGEGAGASSDNRSAIGYYLAYGATLPDEDFYRAYSDYIAVGVAAARGRREESLRGTAGTRARSDSGVAGLFDELYRNNTLTHAGTALRRYDGNGARTRELVAWAGKRNMMAVSEALREKTKGGQTFYDALAAPGSGLTLRLGHAYYYRSYVGAAFPLVGFDTNLGSNAITGASGLFPSVEGYRLNRGFRHLDGYVDTDVLRAASDIALYMGSGTLPQDVDAMFVEMAKSRSLGSIGELLDKNEVAIQGALRRAVGDSLLEQRAMQNFWKTYRLIVTGIVGEKKQHHIWYQVLKSVFVTFMNWRSYVLGTDAQGVEHTAAPDELLRMVLLLAYNLLPQGQSELGQDVMDALQHLVLDVSTAYWQMTVDPNSTATREFLDTETDIAGYKAPRSVVIVERSGKPHDDDRIGDHHHDNGS